jgi:hypothetical protein
MRSASPAVDESFALLHAAGWSVGDVRVRTAAGARWLVTGTNGDMDQPYCLLEEWCPGLPIQGRSPDLYTGASVILGSPSMIAIPVPTPERLITLSSE